MILYLTVLPAIIIFLYFYFSQEFIKIHSLIFQVFVIGLFIAFPAGELNTFITKNFSNQNPVNNALLMGFFAGGLVEELLKFFVLYFFVLEHIADPLDFLKMQLSLLKPGGKIIFEIPSAADPLYSVYDIPAFERFYWSIAHPWYFNEVSTHCLLKKLGATYNIIREQRYDLSNHLVWARDGKPGGMGRFTDTLGEELEDNYKQALIKAGNCDTLVGIVTKE